MCDKCEMLKGVIPNTQPKKPKKNSIIDVMYYITLGILIGIICYGVFVIGKYLVEKYVKQEAQLEELYDNDSYILSSLRKMDKTYQGLANYLITNLKEVNKKPSYEYLKSVTVYLLKQSKAQEKTSKADVGTGVIVAHKDDYYYILTNKHICDIEDQDTCYVSLNGSFKNKIRLDYVKRTESKYDIVLWRTNAILNNKTAIKGIDYGTPQDKVYTVGNYLGQLYIYSEGTYAGKMLTYTLLNLPGAYGCSGSGVFDKNGNLIALIFGMNKLNYFAADTSKLLAIDASIIKLFLKGLIDN